MVNRTKKYLNKDTPRKPIPHTSLVINKVKDKISYKFLSTVEELYKKGWPIKLERDAKDVINKKLLTFLNKIEEFSSLYFEEYAKVRENEESEKNKNLNFLKETYDNFYIETKKIEVAISKLDLYESFCKSIDMITRKYQKKYKSISQQ